MQSIYNSALEGKKGIFISFEEEPEKIIQHMEKNFGWKIKELQKKGLMTVIKLDPTMIARMVEGAVAEKLGTLRIKVRELKLPVRPDKVCVDSLSALSIAFGDEEKYRKYVRELFEMLEEYNSVNLAIAETEQNPKTYTRTGVEEFLADGVIVFYNLKVDGKRENALEILKLRSGKHVKDMIPYAIGPKGIELVINKNANWK